MKLKGWEGTREEQEAEEDGIPALKFARSELDELCYVENESQIP